MLAKERHVEHKKVDRKKKNIFKELKQDTSEPG